MKQEKKETTPEDAYLAAQSDALRILALRAHGAEELRGKLVKKRHAAEAAARAVEALRSKGLVDDEAFAREFVESRSRSRASGRRRLEDELRRKGVAKPAIEKALASVQGDDRAEALKLASARFERMKGVPESKKRARLFGLLKRRGFDDDAVYSAMNRLFRDHHE